jgi:enhanced entry protein EnhC
VVLRGEGAYKILYFIASFLFSSCLWASDDGLIAYNQAHFADAAKILQASDKREGIADYYLARMYWYGYGEKQNTSYALDYFKAAANKSYLPAINFLARYELLKNNNPSEALAWFQKAAAKNDVAANKYCALAYELGFGTGQNSSLAHKYYLAAAAAHDSLAEYKLGEYFLNSSDKRNHKLGLIWLQKASNHDNPLAQYQLALMYFNGNNLPKNLEKYQELIAKAKMQGFTGEEPKITDLKEQMVFELNNRTATEWTLTAYNLNSVLLANNTYNAYPELDLDDVHNLLSTKMHLILPTELPVDEYYQYVAASNPRVTLQKLTFPQYELNNTASMADLTKKAVLGDHQAQFDLANRYYIGAVSERNIDFAINYYRLAALQQDLRAEYMLGLIYLSGDLVAENAAYGFSLIKDAALKGNTLAQYSVALIYDNGYEKLPNVKACASDAVVFYNLAASGNYALAQYNLAEILSREKDLNLASDARKSKVSYVAALYKAAYDGGVKEAALPLAFYNADTADKLLQTKAFDLAQSLAQQNKAAAFLVGLMYAKGLGVSVDDVAAVSFYRKALGLNVADFAYGTSLYASKNIFSAEQEAIDLLENAATTISYADINLAVIKAQKHEDFEENLQKAVSLGNAKASEVLADYYLQNSKDPESLYKAFTIYQEFATKGDVDSAIKLGFLYENGLGVTQDAAMAAHWYELAAESNPQVAAYLLGRLYHFGALDNTFNYDKAKYWYSKAKDSYPPAAVALGFIYQTVDDDYPAARSAYKTAADAGNKIGSYNLVVLDKLVQTGS